MVGSNVWWAIAEWVAATFRDPALLMLLVSGVAALIVFWIAARVRELSSRPDAVPADDLM